MSNTDRSERSRNAALQAALIIMAREGPARLTLAAIARESGLSKGGVTYHFPSKNAVLRALLDHQSDHFEMYSRRYSATTTSTQPALAAQIATMQELTVAPNSFAFAMLAALSDDPGLLARPRCIDAEIIKAIKADADDPELALLRWAGARGLALAALLGPCSLSGEERTELFARLLDDEQWTGLARTVARPGDEES
jgi:AcrR family transcriptional regulator